MCSGLVRRLAPPPAGARNVAPRGRPRVRDRVRGERLSARPRRPPDDRSHRGAARDVARLAGPVPARARGRCSLSQPGSRRHVSPDRGRKPWRHARGGDRARARRVLRGLRGGGDRSLLGRGGGIAHGRRPGCMAADVRAGSRARVRRAHGLQDRRLGHRAGGTAAARAPPRLRPRRAVRGGAASTW